jgi:hypothetical protein
MTARAAKPSLRRALATKQSSFIAMNCFAEPVIGAALPADPLARNDVEQVCSLDDAGIRRASNQEPGERPPQ